MLINTCHFLADIRTSALNRYAHLVLQDNNEINLNRNVSCKI